MVQLFQILVDPYQLCDLAREVVQLSQDIAAASSAVKNARMTGSICSALFEVR